MRASSTAASGVTLLVTIAIAAALGPMLIENDPLAMSNAALRNPSLSHPFGTDDFGRDLFARVVHASRTSLQVGFVAALLATGIGMFVGGLAGLRGGVVDQVLMRATEFVQAIPRFLLIVVAVSLLGSNLALIVLLIGVTSWASTARLFRAQVLAVLARDFVAAARVAGAGDVSIVLRHVLPHARAVVAAEASYHVGGAILAEAGVSFLGLGDPSVLSWGALLGAAQHFVRDAWWMAVFPGIAITLTVLGCNLTAAAFIARTRS